MARRVFVLFGVRSEESGSFSPREFGWSSLEGLPVIHKHMGC